MTNFKNDPVNNVIFNGIKRGIEVTLDNKCYHSAIVLIYSGMDNMAYLNMPDNQCDVTSKDFVEWVEKYIQFPCKEQLTGLDLYGARCSVLHTLGIESNLSRKGLCRQIGYSGKGSPKVRYNPKIKKDFVLVSIEGLKNAFFEGTNRFLIEIFSDTKRAPIVEKRLKNLIHAFEVKTGNEGTLTFQE